MTRSFAPFQKCI